MRIEEINGLSFEGFVDTLGWVFENSPWVAERTWKQRPFKSLEVLHAAMVQEVESAKRDEQLSLLRAHPDLGGRVQMSAASVAEQAGVGLDVEIPELYERIAAYREKFGFPFVYAVKGSTRPDIFLALKIRFESEIEEEFHDALREVYRIAWFRLEGMS